jgi:hypothetical protein
MATITDARLTINHDRAKKLAHTTVTCRVRFTPQEEALMRALPDVNVFKLKCQFWGEDPLSDDHLTTSGDVYYFANSTPAPTEDRTFTDTYGEGVLDEDPEGGDEIRGKLVLENLVTRERFTKRTNLVHHGF